MVLSRPSLRPLTILDLPDDLLRIILDHFLHPAITRGWVQWRGQEAKLCHETIRNVRSVCRVFNELASPLLFPLLHINLDQASLDRAVHLSHSPRLASGVRVIRVGLQCFPGELAGDLAKFREFRTAMLREIMDSCAWHLEGLEFASDSENGYRDEDKAGTEEQRRVYREAIDTYYKIESSWDAYYLDKANEAIQFDDVYQEILRSSYNEFGQKHRQQRQMLESQSFVRTLASCIAQKGRSRISLHHPETILSETPQSHVFLAWDQGGYT